MPSSTRSATPASNLDQLAPGVTIACRDEQWLVTEVSPAGDGYRVRARGVSDYVRDHTATFFTALDEMSVFDPTAVTVVPDDSPRFRHARLWLESTLRRTPVPMGQDRLEVADRMLADPLDYQLSAVRRALSEEHIRPRVLLADAVGLGKTLEIGMIVAELIRRGRGERILVVTPKPVMEQFQQELWTRFAIPLVRLDSQGIQRVRQKLPASKNPFSYFPRVIVSMDTLKSAKYRAQLQKITWDVVVVDEIHNATNAGSLNNQLVRTLAPQAESLILASATPHNGDPNSFKEILRFLDPLSVRPDGSIDEAAARKLIIRRHRNSPEVEAVVGEHWAKRKEPRNILVAASPEEAAVAQELSRSWLNNNPGKDRLFPWVLVKAFLSSPGALGASVDARLKTLAAKPTKTANRTEEIGRLNRLAELNAQVTPERSNKFAALVKYLKEIGVKKGSERRVVVFSERVDTLNWLKANLDAYFKAKDGMIKVMHGGLSDEIQLQIIDEFKREDTPLRILVTGDVASEGVNLHSQCHHLVHYDIPWSLIRIQQRNGRIDRYGQQHEPQITSLLLDTAGEDSNSDNTIGEIHVLKKLIDREFEANKLLGDAAPLMGKYNDRLEEEAIRDVLSKARDFDDVVATPEEVVGEGGFDLMAFLLAAGDAIDDESHSAQASIRAGVSSLYPAESQYLADALNEAFHGVPNATPAAGGVNYKEHENFIVELTPPRDLQRRFDYLPQDYVDYRKVKERLMLATSQSRGNDQLRAAREGESQKSWPAAHFLGPLHPVTEWASDRALAAMAQREIPAVLGTVATPTVLLMGTLTNRAGQVITRSFMVGTPGPLGLDPQPGVAAATVDGVADVYQWLRDVGLGTGAINPGRFAVPEDCQRLVAASVAEAGHHLDQIHREAKTSAEERTERWSQRRDAWEHHGHGNQGMLPLRLKSQVEQEQQLLTLLTPQRTLVRPLLVVLPNEQEG